MAFYNVAQQPPGVRYGSPAQGQQTQGQVNQQWMPLPPTIPGCPPGLEYLTQVAQIAVKQKYNTLELFTSYEASNKYEIRNAWGQQVYYAFEESDCLARQCLKASRGFTLHIVDNMNREVIRCHRDCIALGGCSCVACCDGCKDIVTVEAPVGQVIGYVSQACNFCTPAFDILDKNKQVVLRLKGPCCQCMIPVCMDRDFDIFALDGITAVGTITKEVTNIITEMYSNVDSFGISFPLDLDVGIKAVLIGAVFLLDFMYFEEKHSRRHR